MRSLDFDWIAKHLDFFRRRLPVSLRCVAAEKIRKINKEILSKFKKRQYFLSIYNGKQKE